MSTQQGQTPSLDPCKNNSKQTASQVQAEHLGAQSGYWQMCGQWSLVRTPHDGSARTVARWRCQSWNCEACVARRAAFWFKRAVMGAEVAPHRLRFITLTFARTLTAYQAWQAVGPCWNRLRTRLRQLDPTIEYLRVAEYHKDGYPHLHLLVRSEYLPQRKLSALAAGAGFGPVCWITRPKAAKQAARYVVKYILKATATPFPKGFRRICASFGWQGPAWHPTRRTPDPEASWELVRRQPEAVTAAILASGSDVVVRDWWRLEGPLDVDLLGMVD